MSSSTASVVKKCEYWIRVNLAVELCLKEGLVAILHNVDNDPSYVGLPSNPYHLLHYMKQCQQNANHDLNKGKGKLSRDQWNVLCPPNQQQTNSKDWDITLLVAVIRCELKLEPLGGWNIKQLHVIDQSKGAFVYLIRNLRNEIKHSSFNDMDALIKFNSYWDRVEFILKGLNHKNMQFFHNLKTDPLDLHTIAITETVQQMEHDVDDLKNEASDNTKDIDGINKNIDWIKTWLKHLDAKKADKEDFEALKTDHIKLSDKVEDLETRHQIDHNELSHKVDENQVNMKSIEEEQQIHHNKIEGQDKRIKELEDQNKEQQYKSNAESNETKTKIDRIQLIRLSPNKCVISYPIENDDISEVETTIFLIKDLTERTEEERIPLTIVQNYKEKAVTYLELKVDLKTGYTYHFIICDKKESKEIYSTEKFKLEDDCSVTISQSSCSDVFICGVNNGTKNNSHYFWEENEFHKKGVTLTVNRKILQGKDIYDNNIDQFRKSAETYLRVNNFKDLANYQCLNSDQQTKTFVKNLPKESQQNALVGYNYVNHLKVFGFDNKDLGDLCMEDHDEHENTVLIMDRQKNMVHYIRVSPIKTFKWNEAVKELKRCDDFLKSFLMLHEAKLKNGNLAVYAGLAFPNISSTDIDNVPFQIHDHIKPFIICKDDINSRNNHKLNSVFEKIKKKRKDRGDKIQTQESNLRQILSESIATMVLVDTTLPRLTKDQCQQIVSLLLNEEQYKVVHHPDNHIIITAGYGCGKTLILLEMAKRLFLKQEKCEIIYICSDPYSLLPARIKAFFRDLENQYSNKSNVKLTAMGINQSDSQLRENSRDIKSVLEFYMGKPEEPLVHFFIDEVNGEVFTKQYSENMQNFLSKGKMTQSKVVFAMQSMEKQRSSNDKGHCFEQTNMTLLSLKKSMRMATNIYNLHRIATNILPQTTLIMKRQKPTERKDTSQTNETVPHKVEDTIQKSKNSASETNKTPPNINSNFPKVQPNQNVKNPPTSLDIDIEMCKILSPDLFSDISDINSTKIDTHFTYHHPENGVNVEGYKPTIIYLDESFGLNQGESSLILGEILKSVLNEDLKTSILCNSRQELLLVKFSLEMLLKDSPASSFVYYTPCLDTRLPDDEEMEKIWTSTIQSSSSVLVSDHKGFRGCEAEQVVAFINQEDEYNNHVLVEILTRAVVNLHLLVLPLKFRGVKRKTFHDPSEKVSFKSKKVKEGSLHNVIELWKNEKAVLVKYSSNYSTRIVTKDLKANLNNQYEIFKKKNQSSSVEGNIQRSVMTHTRKWDGTTYRSIQWNGETYTYYDVRKMLDDEQFDTLKPMLDNIPFVIESLRGDEDDRTLLMGVARHFPSFQFLFPYVRDFNCVDKYGWNVAHYIPFNHDVGVGVEMFELIKKEMTLETFHHYINKLDNFDNSPLYYAAPENNHNTIKYLIANGVNVNVRSKIGEYPDEQDRCDDETKRIIRQHRN